MYFYFYEFVYVCLNDIVIVLCKNLDRLILNENGWLECVLFCYWNKMINIR